MDHVEHAPVAQNLLKVKAGGLGVRPRRAAPCLKIFAEVGVLRPRQGVVLEDGQRVAIVSCDGVALVVVAVDLPAKHDLAGELLLSVPLGRLRSKVNDAVAAGQMKASGDEFEFFTSR